VNGAKRDIKSIGLSERDAQILNKSATTIAEGKVADTGYPKNISV